MTKKIMMTKDGIIAGRIEKKEEVRFIILTGDAPVTLNGKELKPRNKFGMIRPYILKENDVLKWGPFFLPKLPLCSLSLLTLSINEHKAKFLPSVQSVYI